MSMVIEIPNEIETALRLPAADREGQVLRELAVALYAQDILTFNKARELARLDRLDFGRLLGRRGVARHYGEQELQEDLRYARGE